MKRMILCRLMKRKEDEGLREYPKGTKDHEGGRKQMKKMKDQIRQKYMKKKSVGDDILEEKKKEEKWRT